jgi:hypothetical protein
VSDVISFVVEHWQWIVMGVVVVAFFAWVWVEAKRADRAWIALLRQIDNPPCPNCSATHSMTLTCKECGYKEIV